MKLGFLRVAAVVPRVNVADCEFNVKNIIDNCIEACKAGAKVVVFPELSISSYTCGDLFLQTLILEKTLEGLGTIKKASKTFDSIVVVGAPIRNDAKLYNCAIVIAGGKILGIVPKMYLPNYEEFREKRWFSSFDGDKYREIDICGERVPFGRNLLFVQDDIKIAIEICEDLWATIPPSSVASLNGANVVLNLSASNELSGKYSYLKNLIISQSARCKCGYVYSSAGYGESTTDLVFAGNAIVAENGVVLKDSKRFSLSGEISIADIDIERLNNERCRITSFSDCASINTTEYTEIQIKEINLQNGDSETVIRPNAKYPFVPEKSLLNDRCEEISNIQVLGLVRRLYFTGIKTVVLGISGGLDSTLALLVCCRAFEKLGYDKKGIVGITMPGFGTTNRTYVNAVNLMNELGVTQKEISIKVSVLKHFEDIGHDANVHDVTYENSQARERTQILMDYANRCGGIVIGTGDLSELVLGWATYNGDHMSMYGVNAGVPKTLVRYLVSWYAMQSVEKTKKILEDIVATPISPELTPTDEKGEIKQKTEDIVGPYELHDFFIYHVLRFGFAPKKVYFLAKNAFREEYCDEEIKKWLKIFYRRFFTQQFKRSCLPDGPKIGSVGLSPRGDLSMPSDASFKMWIEECEKL